VRSAAISGQQTLAQVPPAQRRRLAFMLVPLGIALLVAGLAPVVADSSTSLTVVGALVAVLALGILAVAHGLHRSARRDDALRAEAELDATLMAMAGSCDTHGSDCGGSHATGPCGEDCGECGVDDCAVKSLPRR